MIEFGIRLPVAGPLAGSQPIERAALAATRLGYDALWVHDFLVWTREQDRVHVSCGSIEAVEEADGPPYFHECLTNLAFLAGLTRNHSIKLGVAVLCMPYRSPVLTASQLANIDVLSEGRLIVGVGVGGPKDTGNRTFEVLGIPRAGRYERTREYLAAMQSVWTDPVSSFDGDYVAFSQAEFYPKPIQKPHPPIWLGGFGRKAKEMLVDFGAGWLPGLTMTPSRLPGQVEEIHALAEERGRTDFNMTVGIEITGASIAPTDQEARQSAAATLETVVRGYGGGSHGSVTTESVMAYTLIGSPQSILEKIRAYTEAGVTHFEIKFVYHSIDHLIEQLELFAAEVMPNVS